MQSYHHRFNDYIHFDFEFVVCYQDRSKKKRQLWRSKWIDRSDSKVDRYFEWWTVNYCYRGFFLIQQTHAQHLMIDRWTKTIHTQTRTVEFFSSLVWHNCLFEFAIYLNWNRYPGNIKANSVNVMNSYYFYHFITNDDVHSHWQKFWVYSVSCPVVVKINDFFVSKLDEWKLQHIHATDWINSISIISMNFDSPIDFIFDIQWKKMVQSLDSPIWLLMIKSFILISL